MFRRWNKSFYTLLITLLVPLVASAQTDGTYSGYSPYSVYGIGQLHQAGTAWNRGMGGVGIAARNRRFINITNPASVTARDTLSFMTDFGLTPKLGWVSNDGKNAYHTTFNIEDFVISFPMWNHTAMMVGITPFSDVGYSVSSSYTDIYTGKNSFASFGNGGIYQVFAAAGITLWNRLSVGVQGSYVFGNIDKSASQSYADDTYLSYHIGDSLQVRSFGVKAGVQYEQPLSTTSFLTIGATYRISTGIGGHHLHYLEEGSYYKESYEDDLAGYDVRFGDELGLGLSYRKSDDFLVEVDYTRGDWRKSGFELVQGFSNKGDRTFASSVGQAVRLGLEWTPNRNDIRYFLRRCTYRIGAYYDQSYYTVDGKHVDAVGLTLGMTVPVFRYYNGISLGLDIGQRGLVPGQLKERYIGFNLGFNLFDYWFQKPMYE